MAFTTNTNVFPMIFGRRRPDKLIDGASTPLQLVRLQIEQKVNGDFPLIHQITTTMTFKNIHNIILEGAFEFTLPEQATICGYGLDVDDVIVDGVVVEKQAARIIFEKEVRKRIDPGFVELVTGNVFRTRVYPIEPQKTRTVRVIYQDQATPNNNGYLYQIPIQFQTRLESLDITLTCSGQATTKPTFVADTINNYPQFINKGNGQYTAEWHLNNVEPSVNGDQTVSYMLPDSLKSIVSAVEKDLTLGAYFAISCALPTPTERRLDQLDIPSKRICLLWDASLSRSNSKENRLLELNALRKIFDGWLTRLNQIEIAIIVFRNNIEQETLFHLRSNNWNDFLKVFEDLSYDGATNLSQLSSIRLLQSVNYYFLFSDCISTINNDLIIENFSSNFKAPVWIFNGNHLHEPFDVDFIRYLIQYNPYGGGYLNREKLELNSNELMTTIDTIQIKYNKFHSTSTVQQIYPTESISIPLNSDRFLLVGQIPNPLPNAIQFELEFSINNQVCRLPISLDLQSNESNHFNLIRRLWAQQKLNELNPFKDKYKSDIISLGLEYSLVSQFTSLLVLESLQQHLQYRVCPAKSRMRLYNEYIKYQTNEINKKTNNLSDLKQFWTEHCQWYDQIITDIDRHRAYVPKEQLNSNFRPALFSGFGHNQPIFSFGGPVPSSSTFGGPTPTSGTLGGPVTTSFPFAGSVTTSNPFGGPAPTSGTFGGPVPSFSTFGGSIPTSTTTPFNLDVPVFTSTSALFSFGTSSSTTPPNEYITRISSSSDMTSAYLIYLDERKLHHQSPSFYFDMASYFCSAILNKSNQKEENIQITDKQAMEYGLRILTNILELELEAPQLYRTVAYKLMEIKQWHLALSVLRKIYSLRSDEPQSLRDLAIVHIELGEYDQAYQYLKQILTQTWDERFRKSQTTVLFDLNRLCVLMNRAPLEFDLCLIRHTPVDIRIVVQWDTADTSIKLSIKEPTGQIYNNVGLVRTDIGGYMGSTTFQVSQPVEYLLRNAVNGTYSISLTFVDSAQHTLVGVTTALVYIYKYFGAVNEERQIRTVRLTQINQTIDVGQIEFGDSNLEKVKDELQKNKDECNRLQNQLISYRSEQTQSLISHMGIACDGCLQSPIIGDRYKCLFCPNIDFCQNCQRLKHDKHDSNHPLICIHDSSQYTSSIHLRNNSDIIHLNTRCTCCFISPISGIRYQCMLCKINLCEKCEFLGLHDISHQRLKTIHPE